MRSSSSFLVAVSLVLCLFVPNDQFVHAKGVHLFNVGTTTWDQPPSQQLVQTRSKPIDDFQKRLSTLVRTSRINNVIKIRGGVVISKGKKPKKKNAMKAANEALNQVAPATRAYLLVCAFCTIIHMIGLPAPELFNLEKSRWFEIWRPITSMSYFGPPSMSMANNLYFLIRYGQTLETTNGTGEHAWFLLVQTVILTALGYLLGFPFQAQAMIAATLYVSSHLSPMDIMPFQFGFMITSWQLPFCMMAIDCLSQQNISAAWPHVLGIFSGHLYHFFTKVWPALGGKAWLAPPKWFVKRFGDRKSSNIPGLDFRKAKEAEAAAAASGGGGGGGKKTKKRPMMKGKKLGGGASKK